MQEEDDAALYEDSNASGKSEWVNTLLLDARSLLCRRFYCG